MKKENNIKLIPENCLIKMNLNSSIKIHKIYLPLKIKIKKIKIIDKKSIN